MARSTKDHQPTMHRSSFSPGSPLAMLFFLPLGIVEGCVQAARFLMQTPPHADPHRTGEDPESSVGDGEVSPAFGLYDLAERYDYRPERCGHASAVDRDGQP